MFRSILQSMMLGPIIGVIWELIPMIYLVLRVGRVIVDNSNHLSPSSWGPYESLDHRVHINVSIHFIFKGFPIKNNLVIMNWVFTILMFNSSWVFLFKIVIQNWLLSFEYVVVKVSQRDFFLWNLNFSCLIFVLYPHNIFKYTQRIRKLSLKHTER